MSFDDILSELQDIKIVTLQLGKNVNDMKIPELNKVQEQILDLFKMKTKDMETEL